MNPLDTITHECRVSPGQEVWIIRWQQKKVVCDFVKECQFYKGEWFIIFYDGSMATLPMVWETEDMAVHEMHKKVTRTKQVIQLMREGKR